MIRTLFNKSALLPVVAAAAITFISPNVAAQPELDTAFMNVFPGTSTDCPGYCFGSGWGIDDVKATVAVNTVTLQPNFNTYEDNVGDPYWRDNGGAGPGGNKVMEANLYYEQLVPARATTMEFNGSVDAHTLDAGYTVEAYVTVAPGAAPLAADTDAIIATDTGFTVSMDVSGFVGETIQAGLRITGINANPADEVALGSVVTTIAQLEIGQTPIPPAPAVTPVPALPLWGLFALISLMGYMGFRRKM